MSNQTLLTGYQTLTPAYGRDYKNAKDVEADFRAGKDFLLQPSNRPCSIRDFAPGATANLRYKKLQSVKPVKV